MGGEAELEKVYTYPYLQWSNIKINGLLPLTLSGLSLSETHDRDEEKSARVRVYQSSHNMQNANLARAANIDPPRSHKHSKCTLLTEFAHHVCLVICSL